MADIKGLKIEVSTIVDKERRILDFDSQETRGLRYSLGRVLPCTSQVNVHGASCNPMIKIVKYIDILIIYNAL